MMAIVRLPGGNYVLTAANRKVGTWEMWVVKHICVTET